jgi:SMC interacting uncharacterized protein involved in chromosome segregation
MFNIQSLLLGTTIVCLSLFACNPSNQSNADKDAEHKVAVELTETMRLSHKGMEERLEFLKKENKDFKMQVNALNNPNDSLHNIVALQDSLINQFEDMCKEQKRLIDENEDYIKKHERNPLDAAQVAEQHRVIRENYAQLQLQAAAIVQEVENIKIRIDGAPLSEENAQ